MLLLLSAVYLSPLWGYVCGVVAFLYTCRPSGAFRGWCAVRTLQMYFSNKLLGYLILAFIHFWHFDAKLQGTYWCFRVTQ